MKAEAVDVVVVGARCAGATLATFLARSGVRVLVVDKDRLPSDQVLSTHTIHPPGIAVLDELGVGQAIRSVTPPTRTLRLRKGDARTDVPYLAGRAGYCPRRKRLDGLLQEAAVDAGADLRDRTRVTRVLFEEGRAVGVSVEHDGGTEDIRAGLVVGADGRRSLVAAETGAQEYMAYDAPRAMYWAYWDEPETWRTDRYAFDMYIGHLGDDIRVIFQTDDDQLLVGALPPASAADAWRTDALAALRDNLSRDPVTDSLLAGRPPASSVRGTVKERYFFRQGAGKGWVLVGDAGHHKDFVVGDGITEALLQAESLAPAIVEGGDDALTRWWRMRDVEALPQYYWGMEEGSLDPPGELETLVVAKVGREEKLQRLVARLPDHRCSPYDALPAGAVLPTLVGALLRGRFGVIPEFLAQGRRAAEYGRVLRQRRELLEDTPSESQAASRKHSQRRPVRSGTS